MATPYQRKLYEENKDLFMLIIRLGNKVALQNQLRALCLKLNLYNNVDKYDEIVKELREVGMLSFKEDIYSSKSRLLIVENPVLLWSFKELKEKGININKSRVKSTPNDRIDKSLFKIQYAIRFLDTHKNIKTADELLNELEKESSILYTERRGLEYYNSFLKNYTALHITDKESKGMLEELTNVNKRQKASVPSRKGKGKDYIAKKEQDIIVNFAEGETPSIDIINMYLSNEDSIKEEPAPKKNRINNDEGTGSKETVIYDNNFNSFLERGCILKLGKVEEVKRNNKNKDMHVAFDLYILDINNKLNPIKIAEKTAKAYLMLHDLLKIGYKERDMSICKNCKKNIKSENYERKEKTSGYVPSNETDPKILSRFFYMCDPNDIKNVDYRNCTDNTVEVHRIVYMKVKVLTWNEKRKKDILTDCNYVKGSNYLDASKKNSVFELELKKQGIMDDNVIENRINLKVLNYDLENLYLGGKSRANITEKNKKSSIKKVIKEEVKEAKSEIENSTGVSLDKETIEIISETIAKKILGERKED